MSNNSRQNTRFRWKTAKELEKLYQAGIWNSQGEDLGLNLIIEGGQKFTFTSFADLGTRKYYDSKVHYRTSFIGCVNQNGQPIPGFGYYEKSSSYSETEDQAVLDTIVLESMNGHETTTFKLTNGSWSRTYTNILQKYNHYINIYKYDDDTNIVTSIYLNITTNNSAQYTSSKEIETYLGSNTWVSATGFHNDLEIIAINFTGGGGAICVKGNDKTGTSFSPSSVGIKDTVVAC